MFILLMMLSGLLAIRIGLHVVINSQFILQGPICNWNSFSYPSLYMILSCVQLTMHFVYMMFHHFSGSIYFLETIQTLFSDMPSLKSKTKSSVVNKVKSNGVSQQLS